MPSGATPRFLPDCGLAEGDDPHVSLPAGGHVLDPAADAASLGAGDVEGLLLIQGDGDRPDLREGMARLLRDDVPVLARNGTSRV